MDDSAQLPFLVALEEQDSWKEIEEGLISLCHVMEASGKQYGVSVPAPYDMSVRTSSKNPKPTPVMLRHTVSMGELHAGMSRLRRPISSILFGLLQRAESVDKAKPLVQALNALCEAEMNYLFHPPPPDLERAEDWKMINTECVLQLVPLVFTFLKKNQDDILIVSQCTLFIGNVVVGFSETKRMCKTIIEQGAVDLFLRLTLSYLGNADVVDRILYTLSNLITYMKDNEQLKSSVVQWMQRPGSDISSERKSAVGDAKRGSQHAQRHEDHEEDEDENTDRSALDDIITGMKDESQSILHGRDRRPSTVSHQESMILGMKTGAHILLEVVRKHMSYSKLQVLESSTCVLVNLSSGSKEDAASLIKSGAIDTICEVLKMLVGELSLRSLSRHNRDGSTSSQASHTSNSNLFTVGESGGFHTSTSRHSIGSDHGDISICTTPTKTVDDRPKFERSRKISVLSSNLASMHTSKQLQTLAKPVVASPRLPMLLSVGDSDSLNGDAYLCPSPRSAASPSPSPGSTTHSLGRGPGSPPPPPLDVIYDEDSIDSVIHPTPTSSQNRSSDILVSRVILFCVQTLSNLISSSSDVEAVLGTATVATFVQLLRMISTTSSSALSSDHPNGGLIYMSHIVMARSLSAFANIIAVIPTVFERQGLAEKYSSRFVSQFAGATGDISSAAFRFRSSVPVQTSLLACLTNLTVVLSFAGSPQELETIEKEWTSHAIPSVLKIMKRMQLEISVVDMGLNVLAKLASSSERMAERLVLIGTHTLLASILGCYNAGHQYNSPVTSPRSVEQIHRLDINALNPRTRSPSNHILQRERPVGSAPSPAHARYGSSLTVPFLLSPKVSPGFFSERRKGTSRGSARVSPQTYEFNPSSVILQILVIISRLADVCASNKKASLLLLRSPVTVWVYRVIELHSMEEETVIVAITVLTKLLNLPLRLMLSDLPNSPASSPKHEEQKSKGDTEKKWIAKEGKEESKNSLYSVKEVDEHFFVVVEDMCELLCGYTVTSERKAKLLHSDLTSLPEADSQDGSSSSLTTSGGTQLRLNRNPTSSTMGVSSSPPPPSPRSRTRGFQNRQHSETASSPAGASSSSDMFSSFSSAFQSMTSSSGQPPNPELSPDAGYASRAHFSYEELRGRRPVKDHRNVLSAALATNRMRLAALDSLEVEPLSGKSRKKKALQEAQFNYEKTLRLAASVERLSVAFIRCLTNALSVIKPVQEMEPSTPSQAFTWAISQALRPPSPLQIDTTLAAHSITLIADVMSSVQSLVEPLPPSLQVLEDDPTSTSLTNAMLEEGSNPTVLNMETLKVLRLEVVSSLEGLQSISTTRENLSHGTRLKLRRSIAYFKTKVKVGAGDEWKSWLEKKYALQDLRDKYTRLALPPARISKQLKHLSMEAKRRTGTRSDETATNRKTVGAGAGGGSPVSETVLVGSKKSNVISGADPSGAAPGGRKEDEEEDGEGEMDNSHLVIAAIKKMREKTRRSLSLTSAAPLLIPLKQQLDNRVNPSKVVLTNQRAVRHGASPPNIRLKRGSGSFTKLPLLLPDSDDDVKDKEKEVNTSTSGEEVENSSTSHGSPTFLQRSASLRLMSHNRLSHHSNASSPTSRMSLNMSRMFHHQDDGHGADIHQMTSPTLAPSLDIPSNSATLSSGSSSALSPSRGRRSPALSSRRHRRSATNTNYDEIAASWVRVLEEAEQYTGTESSCSMVLRDHPDIERLVKLGVPPHLRGRVWLALTGGLDEQRKYPTNYYSNLVAMCDTIRSDTSTLWLDEIRKDVHRTLPNVGMFQKKEGKDTLERVLAAYVLRNPETVGYCQSMNLLCGALLTQLESEEDTFWALCALIENRYVLYAAVIRFADLLFFYLSFSGLFGSLLLHILSHTSFHIICLSFFFFFFQFGLLRPVPVWF